MMGGFRTLVTVALCLAITVSGGVASAAVDAAEDNEAPLADAGLDRDVVHNATVYLDASGSRDPDGEITRYEWSIERPDGGTMAPDCPTCGETEFVVRQTGQYNVTVTVTDDDGAERSDTLHVTVSQAEGPDVELTGRSSLLANETADYTATLTAGDVDLSRVDWELDDDSVRRDSVDGETATDTASLSMDVGEHTVNVTVYDELGRSDTATLTATVEPVPDPEEPEEPDEPEPPDENETDGSNSAPLDLEDSCRYADEGPNQNDCEADSVIDAADGTVTIYDTDGDGTITINGTEYDDLDGTSPTVTVSVEEWNDYVQRDRMGESLGGEVYMSNGEGEAGGDLIGSSVTDGDGQIAKILTEGTVSAEGSTDASSDLGNAFNNYLPSESDSRDTESGTNDPAEDNERICAGFRSCEDSSDSSNSGTIGWVGSSGDSSGDNDSTNDNEGENGNTEQNNRRNNSNVPERYR